MPATEFSLALKAAVNAEAKRWWVSSHGEAQGKLTDLARHFQRLCYVRTTDNQRYFFRYADARSFTAMAAAVDESRRPQLLGPITQWTFGTRDGRTCSFRGTAEDTSVFELVLRKAELAALLDAMWPNQLLSNAMERVDADVHEADCYPWAIRLCRMLREYEVEAYPVQLEAMTCVLATRGQALDEPSFSEAVKQSGTLSSVEPIDSFFNAWSCSP